MLELETIEGVGPKTVEILNKLGIYDQHSLIEYYPFRYDILRRSDLLNLNDGDKVVIDGVVEGQPTIIYLSSKLKKIIFRINTKTSILNISIYNRTYLYTELKSGKDVIIIGKYDKLKNTIVAQDVRFDRLPPAPKIEPIYYTTAGFSRKLISKFITNTLNTDIDVPDYIPDYLIQKYNFEDKKEALIQVHSPTNIIDLKKARQRIKYEELFLYMLKINYLKSKIISDDNAIQREIKQDKIDKFIKKLPFELTADQKTAVDEILKDLSNKKRMNRLLQGDVGSGKTVVAFIAAYANYLAKYQTAIMVPTEILAKQHYNDASKLFEGEKIRIELLTSSITNKKKEEIYASLENGEIDLIIGTQSLIQDKVKFKNLGLVITDEQHRFGVNQRDTFKNKGVTADILSMSATPIPRTYALTIYGDMDVSSIKTKPVGRKDVITYYKREKDITDVLELMKNELEKNHQIYVIAPMIEDNENSESETVEDLSKKMEKAFGKLYTIGSVHGKLDQEEKEHIMKNFEKKKIDILISTTVIEVGVNIPNASMMVIFNANLFGLSTLHQLRGRVGRSDIQSYCILLSKQSNDRLKYLEKCYDGFQISEYDFENRGEGDIFGVKQSGELVLKMANIKRDFKMLLKAKEDADEFIKTLFKNKNPDYDIILNTLQEIDKLN